MQHADLAIHSLARGFFNNSHARTIMASIAEIPGRAQQSTLLIFGRFVLLRVEIKHSKKAAMRSGPN